MIQKAKIRICTAFCLALFFIPEGSRAAEEIDRIVAVVNDDLITLSELKESEKKTSARPDSPGAPKDERDVLEQMIEQKLLEQEARKMGISVTDREVDSAIEGVKKQFNLTDEQLNEVLKKQNLTPEAFREQWRTQILSNKVVGTQVKGQIAVTEDEIKKYYEENYGEVQSGKEVRIAHILITFDSPDEEEKARNLAFEVARRANEGEDFGELAKRYSKDTLSAGRGGDLGYFEKGDLVEPLEGAIKDTPVGRIVGPVKSPDGYHVIKVLDRRDSGHNSIDDVREEIRQTIYRQKVEKALKDWIEDVKKTAYIEVKL
jgi:peptidyl-prolyl cis-trans isomerase SurA